jgi:glycine/D-amino acid oxidase-like deaminating enzyme/nitrite reductase/ring-hydroxylating ferredoxin subunit
MAGPMEAPSQTRSPWMSFPVPEFPPLAGDGRADVCIVGAGIAGLTTAYLLTRKGKRVIVIDDGPIGGGMTCRTTAHLSNAIDDRYYEIERLHGEDGSTLAAQSHSAAIDAIEAIVRHERIDCDFARVDGYLFIPPDGHPDELVEEYRAALRAGVEGLVWVDRAPLVNFDTGRCLRFPRQGQLHPLKYLSGLAHAIVRDGGVIHCGVHAQDIEGGSSPCVRTSGGYRIDCADVVVATNTPVNDVVAIHTKQAPYITYVVALRVPPGAVANVLLWDTLDAYHYVRLNKPDGDVLIVGGEDHKTGQADDSERRYANLEAWARERFPMARELVHRWTGQVMETVDGLAFIGRNPGDQHVHVATGDSGQGMTHGTIAGLVITELIHGIEIPWAKLYSPSRKPFKAAREYARENANVAWQYTDWVKGGDVESVDAIRAGSGAVLRRGLHKVAIYRDPLGEVHEMSAACTHLGCIVRWNAADNTWDCKCHGSRFNAFGHVLNGPANSPLQSLESSAAPRVRNSPHTGGRPPTPGL